MLYMLAMINRGVMTMRPNLFPCRASDSSCMNDYLSVRNEKLGKVVHQPEVQRGKL
jgi:hypothetical protein